MQHHVQQQLVILVVQHLVQNLAVIPAATLAAKKDVLGGRFLRTNVVAISAIMATAIAVSLPKDAIGGSFGQTDALFQTQIRPITADVVADLIADAVADVTKTIVF